MIYPLNKYAKVFHPDKSVRTVERIVKRKELLPCNHTKLNIDSKFIFIEVSEFESHNIIFLSNLVKYCKRGIFTHESAAKFCIENNYNMHDFCKIINI